MNHRLHCFVLVSALASLASCVATATTMHAVEADDDERFHAHRAAFGSDTWTVEAGRVEVEFGVTADPKDDTLDTPLTLKWGAGEATEIYVDLSPYQYADLRGGLDAEGFGDMALGVRHRFLEQTEVRPSAAVQFQTKLPTGNEPAGLSSGAIDFFTAGILTKDFDGVAATAFYELGVIGKAEGSGSGTEFQHSFAFVTEVIMGHNWGVYGEAVAILAPTQNLEQFALGGGVSFHVVKRLAWDVGLSVGLNDDTPDLQIFAGFTWGVGGSLDHCH